MSCTADELRAATRHFIGGSEGRIRHALNRKLIYTEGMQAVAETAGAYWLIDLIALKMAPMFAKAWKDGKAGIGIVTLEVPGVPATTPPLALTIAAVVQHKVGESARTVSRITLSLEDDQPVAFEEKIDFTDFPPGTWQFYLGTDELGPDDYVTTLHIPEEY